MKGKTVLLIVLFLFIVLMVRSPKKTTAQITTGEQGAADLAGAVVGGLFGGGSATAKPHKKGK